MLPTKSRKERSDIIVIVIVLPKQPQADASSDKAGAGSNLMCVVGSIPTPVSFVHKPGIVFEETG